MLEIKPEYDNFTNTIVGQIREKLIDAKLYEQGSNNKNTGWGFICKGV